MSLIYPKSSLIYRESYSFGNYSILLFALPAIPSHRTSNLPCSLSLCAKFNSQHIRNSSAQNNEHVIFGVVRPEDDKTQFEVDQGSIQMEMIKRIYSVK
jgi:hypothetical protein